MHTPCRQQATAQTDKSALVLRQEANVSRIQRLDTTAQQQTTQNKSIKLFCLPWTLGDIGAGGLAHTNTTAAAERSLKHTRQVSNYFFGRTPTNSQQMLVIVPLNIIRSVERCKHGCSIACGSWRHANCLWKRRQQDSELTCAIERARPMLISSNTRYMIQ